MASIDKRPNGTWRARWREYPGGPQKSKSFRRKTDAQEFLHEISHRQRTGGYVDPHAGRETFGSWWARWRPTRADLRESSSSRDDGYYASHIAPTFAPVPLSSIDRAMVRAWMAGLVEAGLAPKTVRHAVGLVRQALDVAVEERLILVNPADRIRGLPRVEVDEMQIASPEEIEQLAASIDPRYRVWLWTMASTGLRLGESVALRRGQVDLERRRLTVVESTTEVNGRLVTGPPKTRAGRRSIPLSGPVAAALAEHCAGMGDRDLVFTAPEGGPLRRGTFRRRIWAPATIAVGLARMVPVVDDDGVTEIRKKYEGLRIHDLRHTAVSLWIASGANIKQLTSWAGHTSVATLLDRYGHLLPDHEEPVMAALSGLLEGADPGPTSPVARIS